MGEHSAHSAAGRPLRRAHAAAWFTFVFMAATTMTFQTYHSIRTGQMPWPLAVLYGIGAFVLAITVLEFARHSPSRWVRGGAYALTGGAMYLSASATGDVTLHAAPPHASLLFGLLMDGAALLAIHFILNGPTAAQAVAEVSRKIAEVTRTAEAERSARLQAESAHRAETERMAAEFDGLLSALRADSENAQQASESARAETAGALARAERAEQKLAAAGTAKKRAKTPANARTGSGDADPTNELRAVMELRDDENLRRPRMGGELARRLGIGASTGRRLHGILVQDGALSEYAQSLIRSPAERSQ